MGVGRITSMNSMSGMWRTTKGSADVKSKNIQNEIKDLQQQMQKISSNEKLSVDEKANERKKQQRELSSLNTELQRHQEAFLQSQKREMQMTELQKDTKPAGKENITVQTQTDETRQKNTFDIDKETEKAERSQEKMPAAAPADLSAQQNGKQSTVIFKSDDGTVILKEERNAAQKQADEKKEERIAKETTKAIEDAQEPDTGLSQKALHEIVSADASAQQTGRREAVIAKIRNDITVLKGEMHQDEMRGFNTDKKQAELEKLERKEEQARTFPFPASGKSGSAMKATPKMNAPEARNNSEHNVINHIANLSKEEEQASQQKFSVVLGN